MSFAETVFIMIDKMFDGGQNKKKMLKFKGVDFHEELDVAYGESESEKLDLYHVERPEGEKYPVMFLIHGGGFVAGDKHYRRGLAKWMAEKGFFVVNVNYALAPQYRFPIGLQQIVKAPV